MNGKKDLIFYVCKCVWYLRKSKERIGSLKLELHLVVIFHVDAGNQTCVLCENSQYSITIVSSLQSLKCNVFPSDSNIKYPLWLWSF